ADEPTGNLDKLTRTEIISLLQKINDFGTTVLVTTHDETIVNNLNKRVITLKSGRIVADQKTNGIYKLDGDPEILIDDRPKAPGFALKSERTVITSTPKSKAKSAKAPAAKKPRTRKKVL
ncbi:hypothetical protein IIZ77_02990, partial [Candidatus Saccharibacteria bacterium]|nr:hypothetical protein [Candidatus Saccharibacteria bacterium]